MSGPARPSLLGLHRLTAIVLAAACGGSPAPMTDAAVDSMPGMVGHPDVYRDRVAIFLLADSATLERIRAETGTGYETVADDMMWYRAEAWSWLEERAVPIVTIEGRDSLRFHVAGTAQAYGFDDAQTADVVVLYEPGCAPLALAPIDVATEAGTYFSGLRTPPE